MPWGAAAAIGTAVIGGIAASEGADAQSDAARDASNAQVGASREATQLQRDIANLNINRTAPLTRAQSEAYARQMLMQGIPREQVIQFLRDSNAASYATLPSGTGATLGGGPGQGFGPPAPAAAPSAPEYDADWVDDWNYESSSPSYDFRLNEGQRALERSKAAGSDYFSGDTGIALTRYGQDYASTEWEKDWRRLSELYGGGSATGDSVNIAQNFGGQAGQNILGAGNARASGYLNQGNAQAAGYQGWADSISGAVGMYGGWGGFK